MSINLSHSTRVRCLTRTRTDWLRERGASITAALAAGAGRSFITTGATTGGHEARTPRHSGPRLLSIAAARGFAARCASSAHRIGTTMWAAHGLHAAAAHSEPRNCQMISSSTITSIT